MAAELIFEENKGNWVVRALPKSEKAEKFWYKSINQYTNNVVLSFDSDGAGKKAATRTIKALENSTGN